jgi:hypothetical protein
VEQFGAGSGTEGVDAFVETAVGAWIRFRHERGVTNTDRGTERDVHFAWW